jgi:hypothetical protein
MVFSAVALYCGEGETCLNRVIIGIVDVVLVGLIAIVQVPKDRFKSEIPLAYRRWGYESIS